MTVEAVSNDNEAESDNNIQAEEQPQIKSPFRSGDAVLDISSTAHMESYGNGELREGEYLTRAKMMDIMYRLLTDESREAVYADTNHFIDCDPNAPYNTAISTMANAGIVVGVGGGRFAPDSFLSWSQLITIFARFVEMQTDIEFDNINIGEHWSVENIKTAVARGWIEDSADFSPDSLVTGGELVRFINYIFDLESNRAQSSPPD
jgi:hypothetical protein